MNKYDKLFEVEKELRGLETFGELIHDNNHAGTLEDPMPWPYFKYVPQVEKLIMEIYNFEQENPDFDLKNYQAIIENASPGEKALGKVDVENASEQLVMALFMAMVRAERFCDGFILGIFDDRIPFKWFDRLHVLTGE